MKFVLLASALLCSVSSAFAESDEKVTVKFGGTFALTGKLSNKGQDEAAGIALAFEDFKLQAKRGIDPVLITEDNLGEPKQAVSGFQKLLAADQVDVLLSAFTHISQAVKGLAAQHGKPFIYISGAKTIAAENPFFFRDYYDVEAIGGRIAQAAAHRGFLKAAYLREDSEACSLHEAGFQREAARLKIKVVSREEYTSGEVDFRPLLLRIARSAPAALITCTWRNTDSLMRRMDELNLLSIPVFHLEAPDSDINDTPEMRTLYEKNHSVSTWFGFVEDSPSPSASRFAERFKNRFGRKPMPDALFAYDLGVALAKAANECVTTGSFDKNCFVSQLSLVSFEGVSGPFRFDETRNSTRPVLLIEVRGGKWVEKTE